MSLRQCEMKPAIRTIEAALKESRKRLKRGKRLTALWFLFRTFQEIEEAEVILAARERGARR